MGNPGRTAGIRNYLHGSPYLGSVPDYLGLSDLLAGPCYPAHYTLSIGDPPGSGTS